MYKYLLYFFKFFLGIFFHKKIFGKEKLQKGYILPDIIDIQHFVKNPLTSYYYYVYFPRHSEVTHCGRRCPR
jgi:hypothetical protein